MATIKVIYKNTLKNIADEFYGEAIKSANKGELDWTQESGVEVERK